jgi:hypothetical protein
MIDEDSNLYTLDLITVKATPIGNTTRKLSSLQFGDNGNLYAGGNVLGVSPYSFWIINTVTAAPTFVSTPLLLSVPSSSPILGLTLVSIPSWMVCCSCKMICGRVDPELLRTTVGDSPTPPDPECVLDVTTVGPVNGNITFYESICPIDKNLSMFKLCIGFKRLTFSPISTGFPIPGSSCCEGNFQIKLEKYLLSRGYNPDLPLVMSGIPPGEEDNLTGVGNMYVKLAEDAGAPGPAYKCTAMTNILIEGYLPGITPTTQEDVIIVNYIIKNLKEYPITNLITDIKIDVCFRAYKL